MLCLGLGMRVFRLCQWVLGIALLAAGCTLNPQPFPPYDNDGGLQTSSDAAAGSPDANGVSDATKGTDADANAGDAATDAPSESEAGDAAIADVVVEGG
jgi:hypothetical protein